MVTFVIRILIAFVFTFGLMQALYGELSHLAEYQVVKELGSGDQARVYKANDAKQHVVALKVFYTTKAADDEYAAGKLLNHPNIMKLYKKQESYTPSGEKVSFIVMELIKGRNLDQMQEASLSKKEAITLARQLVSALRHSFSKGLIHDDLWSENIFIDDTSNLKLIDLGSYDPLPSLQKGQAPKGKYRLYFQVIEKSLKRLLALGKWTNREQEKLESKLKFLLEKSDNCPMALEYHETIEANLELCDQLLMTCA